MDQNWVVWLIFGLLLALLVGFLVFSYVKDKRKNRRLAQKRAELKRATMKSSKELAIKIYTLIQFNNQKIIEIRPGQSDMKMKHINFTAKKFLKDIYESKVFKTIYLDSSDADPDYAKNLKNLIDRKSNLWNKYCQNEMNYFKRFHDELISDDKFKAIEDEANKEINNYFKEVLKN